MNKVLMVINPENVLIHVGDPDFFEPCGFLC